MAPHTASVAVTLWCIILAEGKGIDGTRSERSIAENRADDDTGEERAERAVDNGPRTRDCC